MLEERAYQSRGIAACVEQMKQAPTLLVVPTGGGKTIMLGTAAREMGGKTAWLTHTKDLVDQSAKKLRELGMRVGVLASGYDPDPYAQIQVVSIQSALSWNLELRVQNLVLDEAHHFVAEEWRGALEKFHATYTLGGTATPERADGKPLGDMFSTLLVPTSYSELISLGVLVPLRVLRPEKELQRGIALNPLEAYIKYGECKKGFGYCRNIAESYGLADEFSGNGIASAVIEADTIPELRKVLLARLENGSLSVLWNVYALTEGVDIPSAEIGIFACNFGHISRLLQASGRILRSSPGKSEALLIDLPGITHRLGLPIEDREYSLTGIGIRRTASGLALKVCLKCGMTFVSAPKCPRCGFGNPTKNIPKQKIYNEELREVYNGTNTPDWAKDSELQRLKRVARDKNLGLGWVQREFKLLFGHEPKIAGAVDTDAKREEYDRLAARGAKLGYKPGWAAYRYRIVFGAMPPKRWELEWKNVNQQNKI